MLYCLPFTLEPSVRIQSQYDDSAEDSKRAGWVNRWLRGYSNQKTHSDRYDKKITPEFAGEILAMMDYDPRKSVWFIAWDMAKFLIRQVVNEDLRYFSDKIRKSFAEQEERLCCKDFGQTQISPLTDHGFVFLWWEKFQPRSDDGLTEQPLA